MLLWGGSAMHMKTVCGLGALALMVGLILLLLGIFPIVQWFVAGAVILGVAVGGAIRLYRKFHPPVVQLDVGRQMRQP